MTALEDSLILLKEISPAFFNLKRAHELLKQEYEADKQNWLFQQTAAILQKDNAEKKLKTSVKAGRREKIKTALISFGIGALTGIALSL